MSETDWTFAELEPTDELAKLHFFSVQKQQGDRKIEFHITVREFANRNKLAMRFFAQADKQTNQNTLPYTPSGWGETLLKALGEVVKAIHQFPYEGD